jgi:hypothetical protein
MATMPSELTDELRAALERVPTTWDMPCISDADLYWLLDEGLIEIIEVFGSGAMADAIRCTPAGRAALGSGG